MKIAYLANVKFPNQRAHSVQIAHMCNAFVACGAEVTLFVNKRSITSKKETDAFFGFESKFKVVNLSPRFFFPRIKITFYLSELIFSLSYWMRSDKNSFDFVITRSEWIAFFLVCFGVRNVVWESHVAELSYPARMILKKGIKCVCISEGIFEEYLQIGVPRSQLLVAHDAVDESFFQVPISKVSARKNLGLPNDQKIVMYIGGLDIWKGVETLFEASEILEEKIVAIGGRPEEIVVLGKKYPKVVFLGTKSYKELPQHQQAADILVVPSSAKNPTSQKFTSPLKLFAHMASGVPLLVSAVPSNLNVLGSDYKCVFTADNAQSLSLTVQNIFNDYTHYQSQAQTLKERSTSHTWKNRATKILAFIKNHE